MYIYIDVYICVYIYICLYMYIYIYIYNSVGSTTKPQTVYYRILIQKLWAIININRLLFSV